MNIIQKALEMQGIYAGWSGNEPTSVGLISNAYIKSNDNDGYPRIVRSSADTGKDIDIKQLKIDFKSIMNDIPIKARIAEHRLLANELILDILPLHEQNNLITQHILLSKIEKPTEKDKDDIMLIEYKWQWIADVQKASKSKVKKVKWPKFPGK